MPPQEPIGAASTPRRSWRSWLALLALISVPVVLVLGPWIGFFAYAWWADFWNPHELAFHRARYDAIVAKIGAVGLSPWESAAFWISPSKNPATLRRLSESENQRFTRADEEQLIHARLDAAGSVRVHIITYSFGHGGRYGLYYSSPPATRQEAADCIGGGVVSRVVQHDANWWSGFDGSQ